MAEHTEQVQSKPYKVIKVIKRNGKIYVYGDCRILRKFGLIVCPAKSGCNSCFCG